MKITDSHNLLHSYNIVSQHALHIMDVTAKTLATQKKDTDGATGSHVELLIAAKNILLVLDSVKGKM